MFARVLYFDLKWEKKDEFYTRMKNEILPILRNQAGFLEVLPFTPETKTEKVMHITLWAKKADAEKYEKEVYPKILAILKPYFTSPTVRLYNVETALCEHFKQVLAA